MDKDVSTYLKQILDSIILTEEYIAGVSGEQFLADKQLQDSVAMRLHLIGEISNKLPEDLTKRISQIPWVKIVGMRNLIAHQYLEVNQTTVWNTLISDLPLLKQALLEELKKY